MNFIFCLGYLFMAFGSLILALYSWLLRSIEYFKTTPYYSTGFVDWVKDMKNKE